MTIFSFSHGPGGSNCIVLITSYVFLPCQLNEISLSLELVLNLGVQSFSLKVLKNLEMIHTSGEKFFKNSEHLETLL